MVALPNEPHGIEDDGDAWYNTAFMIPEQVILGRLAEGKESRRAAVRPDDIAVGPETRKELIRLAGDPRTLLSNCLLVRSASGHEAIISRMRFGSEGPHNKAYFDPSAAEASISEFDPTDFD